MARDGSAERIADPGVGNPVFAIDASGVAPQQYLDRVTGAAGDSRRRDSRVEPQRHGGVPQVVGPRRQRRRPLTGSLKPFLKAIASTFLSSQDPT
jgi:hypothetical protein